MAFNAVSAPAYVGVAVRQIVDCSLDGDEDIDVVILAKDEATLKRFRDHALKGHEMTKFYKVAMAETKTLRIFPIEKSPQSATPQSPVGEEDW